LENALILSQRPYALSTCGTAGATAPKAAAGAAAFLGLAVFTWLSNGEPKKTLDNFQEHQEPLRIWVNLR
jgi:hypothetical protein